MVRFVRVAHRQGWEVEVVGQGGAVEKTIRGSRSEALDHAMTFSPDWIEVGDIAGLDTPQQHHGLDDAPAAEGRLVRAERAEVAAERIQLRFA